MQRLKLVCFLLSSAIALSLFAGCRNYDDRLFTSKKTYATNEEIIVTARGEGDARVGVYRKSDKVGEVEAIRSYPVSKDGYVSGESYVLQKSAPYSESRQAFRNFPAGEYKVVLFSDGTNAVCTVYFTVSAIQAELPSAPSALEYVLDNAYDGLADGKLTISFADQSDCCTDVVLYWADGEGILNDYTALATVRISGNPTVYEMYSSTIIPQQATRLVAYGKNIAGTSENYCETALPSGCQFNFNGQILSEFQVVSDVHISIADTHLASDDAKQLHNEHWLAMLNDAVSLSPGSDGVFVVGDIANSGRPSEWSKADELYRSVQNAPPVYYAVGNHDLYGGSYNTQIGYFYNYASTDCVYYERTVNGYSHLFLGSQSNNLSGVDADLSDEQLSWLDERLQAITSAQPSKPVFVYLHQSLYDTVAGSFAGQGWNGIMQDAELRAILSKYPSVCMFNGHSHWDLNTRGSMYVKDGSLPNIFNTASVAYLWSSYYLPTGEYMKGSQGYYVKVYGDKVLVLGRDFASGKWIPSACFRADFL